MIAKLLAAALVAVPVSASAPPLLQQAAIFKVTCIPGLGSAFRIGPKLMVSVNHVTSMGGCFIQGHAINVIRVQGDFSLLATKERGPYLIPDCNGFVAGRKYRALGFARGLDKLVAVDLEGTGRTDGVLAVLIGTYTMIPGQSGGPVVDAETGKAVGTNNVYNYAAGESGSIPLKDTPVCRS